MDKATKTRQQAHRVRRDNEKRKQRIKEAGGACKIYPSPSPRRPQFGFPVGPQMSLAAAEMLFSRILR